MIPGTQNLTDSFYSRKFPELHPTLAIDTSAVAYDVRKPPQDGVLHAVISAVGNSPALKKQVTHIRLISKDFPWQFDIKLDLTRPYVQPITVANVWESLYGGLHVPIADSEWGCLVMYDKHKAEAALRAATRRGRESDEPMLRVDWLGEGSVFKGLDKDKDFMKRRLFPTETPCEDTWLGRVMSRCSESICWARDQL
jgi:hypothetical protein